MQINLAFSAALVVLFALNCLATAVGAQQQQCQITPTQKCSLSSFPPNQPVLVQPPQSRGGPICITGEPYQFQVVRGDPTRLLIHLQGGGACWDSVSLIAGLCTTSANAVPAVGIFDRANQLNPYKNYTIIAVLYCSGDTHLGNYDWNYFFNTVSVTQRGAVNFQAVFSYIQQQIAAQRLGGKSGILQSLVLSGSSAGAMGQQVWSGYALARLKYFKAAVIVDSLAGLFPHAALKPLLKKYNLCRYVSTLIPATSTTAKVKQTSAQLAALCNQGQMTIQNVLVSTLQSFPTVPFSFIQSKQDSVQIDFYNGVDMTQGFSSQILDGPTFYTQVQSFLQVFNQFPNWMIYWVSGDTHVYLTEPWFYQANAQQSGAPEENDLPAHLQRRYTPRRSASRRLAPGSNSTARPVAAVSPPPLYQWVSKMPLAKGASLASECSNAGGLPCSTSFEGKIYVQK